MDPLKDIRVYRASSQQEFNSLGFYRPQQSRIPTPRVAVSQSSTRDLTTGASRGKTSQREGRLGTDMSVWTQQLRPGGLSSIGQRAAIRRSRTTQTEQSDSEALKHPAHSDTSMTLMWKGYGECPKIFTLRESSSGTLTPPGNEVSRNVVDGRRGILKSDQMVSAIVQTDGFDSEVDTNTERFERVGGSTAKNIFNESLSSRGNNSSNLVMMDGTNMESQLVEDKERRATVSSNIPRDESGIENELLGYLSEGRTVEEENEDYETLTLVNRPTGDYQNEDREALRFYDQHEGAEVEYQDLDRLTLITHCDGQPVDYEVNHLGKFDHMRHAEFDAHGNEVVENSTFNNKFEEDSDGHCNSDLRNRSNSAKKSREKKVNFIAGGGLVKSIEGQKTEASSQCKSVSGLRKFVRCVRRLVISMLMICLLVPALSSLLSYGYCVATFYPTLIPVPAPPPQNFFLRWLFSIMEAPAVLRLGVNWENVIHGMNSCLNPTVLCPWPFCEVFDGSKNGRKIWTSHGAIGRFIKESF